MALIPAFLRSVSNRIKGDGKIFIPSRKDAVSSGMFDISLAIQFGRRANDELRGSILLKADLRNSLKATFTATSIELIHAHHNHEQAVYLTGSCNATTENPPDGLRYWVKVAYDHYKKDAPECVGFVVHDKKGNRVAYGTGPLVSGSIQMNPNLAKQESEWKKY